MQPEPPARKPRRERHLVRWLFIVILAILGWYGWKAYDFQQAVKRAEELGWEFESNDPIAIIREDWRNAFRKDTWSDTARSLSISPNDSLEDHYDLIRRLKPTQLEIWRMLSLRDLSQLKGLSRLTKLTLSECPNLTNIDAIKELKNLTDFEIIGSPALSNIDALKELKKLEHLGLSGCSALSNVDALRELKALKYLNLDDCIGLKNVDGLQGLTQLVFLRLEFCEGLPEASLDAVKSALPTTRFGSSIQK